LPARKTYGINALALELGRHRNILGAMLADVEPDEIKKDRKFYTMKTVVDRLIEGKPTQAKADKIEAESQIQGTKAELLRMELEEKQAKLVHIEEVQRVLAPVFTALKTRVLAISSRLAARIAATKQPRKVKELLDKAIRSALEEVSALDPGNIKLKRGKK